MNTPDFTLITSPHDWQACLKKLQQEPRLAIDLEANSMFAYQEQICLIQISIPNKNYIVDPLTVLNLDGLGEIIMDSAVEKVFHAGEYDMILMKREHGWQLNNLFDTMWAARVLGYKKYGLANLLETMYGVKMDKKYQRSDWRKRPLSSPQLAYACLDTHYLLKLRDDLNRELRTAGFLKEAAEIFEQQTRVVPADISFDPDAFWKVNGVRELSKPQKAVVRELFIYRDQEARRRNQPHFKVFSNNTLLALAQAMPKNRNDLQRIRGMSGGQVRRYGRPLLEIIRSSVEKPLPPRPKRSKRRPDDEIRRYEALRQWRKRRAQKRGVESDVILSKEALHAIARLNPQTVDQLADIYAMGDWSRKKYGAEIIGVVTAVR